MCISTPRMNPRGGYFQKLFFYKILSSFSALSSVDQYIYAHDTLAAAIECGHLHGVIQLRNGTLTHNGATHATSVDRMSDYSAHAV